MCNKGIISIEADADLRDARRRRLVVRNARAQSRTVCAEGKDVGAPRVNDRRVEGPPSPNPTNLAQLSTAWDAKHPDLPAPGPLRARLHLRVVRREPL